MNGRGVFTAHVHLRRRGVETFRRPSGGSRTRKRMMNFDLLDTRAGKDIYEEGMQVGEIKNARNAVIRALEERFQIVPTSIVDKVKAIGRKEILDSLFRQAMRCSDIEGFDEVLARAT